MNMKSDMGTGITPTLIHLGGKRESRCNPGLRGRGRGEGVSALIVLFTPHKTETLSLCCSYAGPSSQTMDQH